MKPHTEMNEGPDAFTRFDQTMGSLLSVSHDELMRREQEYKRQSAANPHRPGPKPKVKQKRKGASRASA